MAAKLFLVVTVVGVLWSTSSGGRCRFSNGCSANSVDETGVPVSWLCGGVKERAELLRPLAVARCYVCDAASASKMGHCRLIWSIKSPMGLWHWSWVAAVS